MGALLVYDITNKESFLNIPKWMEQVVSKEADPLTQCDM